MLKKLTLCVLCLLFTISLCACGGETDKGIVGTWKYNEHIEYEFTDDGKGCLCQDDAHYHYTYKTDGDQLSMDFEANIVKDCVYTYTIVDNQLTLIGGEGTDGGTYKLNRVK